MQRVSKYAEAVSEGEMTLEEALQAVAEDEREQREREVTGHRGV
jgi:hypothetical protein